jgi:hypothetical protein
MIRNHLHHTHLHLILQKNILVCLSLCVLFYSCKKNTISLPPEIETIYTPSEHDFGIYADAGKTNRFYITVKDDQALESIQTELSTKDGFHSHVEHGGNMIGAFKAPNIGTWNAEKSMQLSGTDSVVIFKFNAPNDIAGSWNLNIALRDEDGNMTYASETVMIQNDSLPSIIPVASVPVAQSYGIVELTSGNTFTFEGNVADMNYLHQVTATLYHEGSIEWYQEWNFDHQWIFELSEILLPPFDHAGDYTLVITATDKNNWHNWVQSDIHVLP